MRREPSRGGAALAARGRGRTPFRRVRRAGRTTALLQRRNRQSAPPHRPARRLCYKSRRGGMLRFALSRRPARRPRLV